MNSEIVPIIVSAKLEEKYPIGAKKDLAIYNEDFSGGKKFIAKVIGVLRPGEYIYISSGNQGIPELNDLFLKTNNNENFILMPNVFTNDKVSYFTNGGFIIEYDDTNSFLHNSYKKVINDGVGTFNRIEDLEKNFYSNLITSYDLYIFLFIITYIFLMASIGGYNLLATLNYKRLLTIYYITGMKWKSGICLITIRNLFLIIVPTIICSIQFNKLLERNGEYVFNINVVLVTMLLYFFVFIITTLGSIFTLKNTKPIEVLKEVE